MIDRTFVSVENCCINENQSVGLLVGREPKDADVTETSLMN